MIVNDYDSKKSKYSQLLNYQLNREKPTLLFKATYLSHCETGVHV